QILRACEKIRGSSFLGSRGVFYAMLATDQAWAVVDRLAGICACSWLPTSVDYVRIGLCGLLPPCFMPERPHWRAVSPRAADCAPAHTTRRSPLLWPSHAPEIDAGPGCVPAR